MRKSSSERSVRTVVTSSVTGSKDFRKTIALNVRAAVATRIARLGVWAGHEVLRSRRTAASSIDDAHEGHR